MFFTHLKIAWRNLIANRGYTFINIFGLILGFSSVLLLSLYIYDEFTYNHYFKQKDHIAQVIQTQQWSGLTNTWKSLPRPIENALTDNYGEYFEYIVMSSWNSQHYLENGDTVILTDGSSMHEDGPKMLDLEILYGTIEGLKDVNSIMLSKSKAEALLGEENSLGKTVRINDKVDMKVTAVYKDIPYNTSFHELHFITPWKYYINSEDWIKESIKYWDSNSFQMFVKRRSNISFEEAEDKIKFIKRDAMDMGDSPFPILHLLPMEDWKLRNKFVDGKQQGGLIEVVLFLVLICFVILMLASINFMNLSTARAQKRAKEVAIKKTIGGQRTDLLKQFFGETFIAVFIAFIISLLIVYLTLESFNMVTFKQIVFPWTEKWFWLISLAIVLIITFISGAYPALFLSSLNPIKVLNGWNQHGKASGNVRKVLVCLQFIISTGLIVVTIVLNRQMKYSMNRVLGYNPKGLLQIDASKEPFSNRFDIAREAFLNSGAVTDVVYSSSPPTQIRSIRSGFTWEGKSEELNELFDWVEVSPGYMKTLGIKVIEGREFSRDFKSDTMSLLINKKAATYMGLKSPIGKVIRDEDDKFVRKIIGIVDDVLMESPFKPIKPTFYVFNSSNLGYYLLRLNKGRTTEENMNSIKAVYASVFPNLPLEFSFVEDDYNEKFNEFGKTARIIFFFTFLAILISCLGLLGLTSFVAEQRTKEIGIRKSIGSTVFQVWLLLAKDFIILMLISCVIALPLSYKLGEWFLKDYEYRISLEFTYLILAALITLGMGLATVSYHAIKAAKANPIKSLKTE